MRLMRGYFAFTGLCRPARVALLSEKMWHILGWVVRLRARAEQRSGMACTPSTSAWKLSAESGSEIIDEPIGVDRFGN